MLGVGKGGNLQLFPEKVVTAEHFNADEKDLVKRDWLTMQLTKRIMDDTDP